MENDRLLDQMEKVYGEKKQLVKTVDELKGQLEQNAAELQQLKATDEESRKTADASYKSKCALESTIKEHSKQIHILKIENDSMVIVKKEMEGEIKQLKGEFGLRLSESEGNISLVHCR